MSDFGTVEDPRIELAIRNWCPNARVVSIDLIVGGESGVTMRVTLAAAVENSLVVKMAPVGKPPTRNRDVLRQARILLALEGNPRVRVPSVLIDDPGSPPDIPPFFVMTDIEGEAFEPNIDAFEPRDLPPASWVEARADAAIEMMVGMHSTEWLGATLGDEPLVTLESELARWTRVMERVPQELVPRWEQSAEAIAHRIPAQDRGVLVHGDFRLGNLICRDAGVFAIIDWEIWSLSDKRVDLAWMMLTADPELHPLARRACPGMPTPSELLNAYERYSETKITNIDWFTQLTLFKLAAMCALIVRNRREAGGVEDQWSRRTTERIPLMLTRSLDLAGG